MKHAIKLLVETIILTTLSIIIGITISRIIERDIYGNINLVYIFVIFSASFLAGFVFELVIYYSSIL